MTPAAVLTRMDVVFVEPARRSWWRRGDHRLKPTSQITVADLQRQARREAPSPVTSPILIGERTCYVRWAGVLPDPAGVVGITATIEPPIGGVSFPVVADVEGVDGQVKAALEALDDPTTGPTHLPFDPDLTVWNNRRKCADAGCAVCKSYIAMVL
jgi:hypothetical protein